MARSGKFLYSYGDGECSLDIVVRPMSRRRLIILFLMTGAALCISSCGVLGRRLEVGTQIAAGNSGQVNAMGTSTTSVDDGGIPIDDIDFENQMVNLTAIAQAVVQTWDAAASHTPEATTTNQGNNTISLTTTQSAIAPTSTATPTSANTESPAATETQKTKKPKATATPLPCNAMRFVADVTVPDGTVMEPGQMFYKRWRVQNVGSCTWRPDYKIQYYGGLQMGAPYTNNLGGYVDPGMYINLWLKMYAPPQGGSFRSEWIMLDSSGTSFGIGEFYDEPFYVEIIVIGGGEQFPVP